MMLHIRHTLRKTAPLLAPLLLAALALFGAAPGHAQGVQTLQIVSPSAEANTEGNSSNNFPFNNNNAFGAHYQQVFTASDFTSFTGPGSVSVISFRPDATLGTAFSGTDGVVQISLSTTAKAADGLSTTFASNLGANNTVVYNGALSLSSTDTGPAGGPKNFDINIPLQTLFNYDPSQGNLLLDVVTTGPTTSTPFDFQVTPNDTVSRVFADAAAANATPTVGSADTGGLVTRFTIAGTPAATPEPSGMAVFALGAMGIGGLFLRARKRATQPSRDEAGAA